MATRMQTHDRDTMEAPAHVETATHGRIRDRGSIIAGAMWMLVISLLLFWLPLIGPLIGGIVGGKRAGGIGAAIIAAFLPAIARGDFRRGHRRRLWSSIDRPGLRRGHVHRRRRGGHRPAAGRRRHRRPHGVERASAKSEAASRGYVGKNVVRAARLPKRFCAPGVLPGVPPPVLVFHGSLLQARRPSGIGFVSQDRS